MIMHILNEVIFQPFTHHKNPSNAVAFNQHSIFYQKFLSTISKLSSSLELRIVTLIACSLYHVIMW